MSASCKHKACFECLTKYTTSKLISSILDSDKHGKPFKYLRDSYFKCLHHEREEKNEVLPPCGNFMIEEVVRELLVRHELYKEVHDLREKTEYYMR